MIRLLLFRSLGLRGHSAILLLLALTFTVALPASGLRQVDYDFSRGLDLTLLEQVQGEAVCDLSRCASNASAREETKDRAYRKAFERIHRMGRTYHLAEPYYLPGFKRLLENRDLSILRQDIVFIKATEFYNDSQNEYKYVVRLGVRRVPTLDPRLFESLLGFLAKHPPSSTADEYVFDLEVILARLRSDPAFSALLKRLEGDETFRRELKFKDDDTQSFIDPSAGLDIKIQGYDKGQYSVNAVIGSVIDLAVARAARGFLGKYRTVSVICEGATDSLPVTGVIIYPGSARYTLKGRRLSFEGVEGTLLQKAGIRNNIHLSFARAYEGSRALHQLLGPVSESGRVELFYVGLGEVPGRERDHPGSRRISFRLKPTQPLAPPRP